MVHPSMDCILLTPINPRSLSFRPILLPNNANIILSLSNVIMQHLCFFTLFSFLFFSMILIGKKK